MAVSLGVRYVLVSGTIAVIFAGVVEAVAGTEKERTEQKWNRENR